MKKNKNFLKKIKSFLFKDETIDLSEEQKKQLEIALQERKFELIAQKKFRDLERKFSPKNKKSFSERLAELKKYRERNLRRQKERSAYLKNRREAYERKVAANKLRAQRIKSGQLKTADIVRKRLRGEKI